MWEDPEIVALQDCRYDAAVVVEDGADFRPAGDCWLNLVVVRSGLDAADDWIAERAVADDIVITADIPLAARCLETGAAVLDHKGGRFAEQRIGEALASREILAHLREAGVVTKGPAPFRKQDRSQFLQRLDQTIQSIRKSKARDS